MNPLVTDNQIASYHRDGVVVLRRLFNMTAIRFGHDNPHDDETYDVTPLVRVAEQLSPF